MKDNGFADMGRMTEHGNSVLGFASQRNGKAKSYLEVCYGSLLGWWLSLPQWERRYCPREVCYGCLLGWFESRSRGVDTEFWIWFPVRGTLNLEV